MAARTVTVPLNKSELGLPHPHGQEIHPVIADDPTVDYVGSWIYIKPNRKGAKASAAAAGTAKVKGLCTSQRGRALSVMKRGFVEGIDCESMTPGDPLFLADAAGGTADAAGTVSVKVGSAMPCTDGYGSDVRLLAYVDVPWNV